MREMRDNERMSPRQNARDDMKQRIQTFPEQTARAVESGMKNEDHSLLRCQRGYPLILD